MAKPKSTPHIYEYLRKWQNDPTSRVFAPLAEAYRKAGLVDEAIEIAREGLKIHPRFFGGRVALARALFDKKDFEEVLLELREVVVEVPDNLVAQRLVAESNLMLGRTNEALGAFKMLLYFSPSDEETAKIVQELEAQAYERGAMVLRQDPEPMPEFTVQSAQFAFQEDPNAKQGDWIRRIETLQGLLQRVERYKLRLRA